MSTAEKARVLLNTNAAPGFRLEHGHLSTYTAEVLRVALVDAAELVNWVP